MIHPEFMKVLVRDHAETLRRSAVGQPAGAAREAAVPRPTTVQSATPLELRLCRVGDLPALELLATLDGTELPDGTLVVAVVGGRIVAALPVSGGAALRDPFVHTAELLPLLRLRVAQIRGSRPRRHLLLPGLRPLGRRSRHA